MNLTVREWQPHDIENIVDYFYKAEVNYIRGMGADKSKLPAREIWVGELDLEHEKLFQEKGNYYIIWEIDNKAIGHSNINNIKFGKSATMHLHIWNDDHRKSGHGLVFLKQTIPFYFKNFQLEKLICEPYAENPAPNRTLKKLGFELIGRFYTTPGKINFPQWVNRYQMTVEFLNSNKQ